LLLTDLDKIKMKKYKEGDVIRLSVTFVDATIENNNCDGTYDIRLSDNIIKKNVKCTEFEPPVKELVLVRYNRLIEFRNAIERYFDLNPTECQKIVNYSIIAIALIIAWGFGFYCGVLTFN